MLIPNAGLEAALQNEPVCCSIPNPGQNIRGFKLTTEPGNLFFFLQDSKAIKNKPWREKQNKQIQTKQNNKNLKAEHAIDNFKASCAFCFLYLAPETFPEARHCSWCEETSAEVVLKQQCVFINSLIYLSFFFPPCISNDVQKHFKMHYRKYSKIISTLAKQRENREGHNYKTGRWPLKY